MPRDYVKSRPRRHQKSAGPSGVIWLLMGVLIGLIIAGVFYVKNQNRSKQLILPEFSQKAAEAPAAATTTTPAAPQQPRHTLKTPAKPVSTQNLQTQFDFYNVLPSQKVIGPSGDEDTAEIQKPDIVPSQPKTQTSPQQTTTPPAQEETPVEPAETASAKPDTKNPPEQKKLPPVVQATPVFKSKAASTAAPAAEKSGSYIVQVAALSDSGDADQLKAQLTLLGFEVKVSTTEKNGKTFHRVWLGPFHTIKEAESIQKQLQENMISAKVLKSNG